jgi:hypothetical protein
MSLRGVPFSVIARSALFCHCEERPFLSLRGAPFSVIARSVNDEAISERDSSFHSEQAPQSQSEIPRFRSEQGLPRGVYPELCKILRSAQNDTERRARNLRGELLNNLVNSRGGLWLFREMRSRGGGFTASGGDTG